MSAAHMGPGGISTGPHRQASYRLVAVQDAIELCPGGSRARDGLDSAVERIAAVENIVHTG